MMFGISIIVIIIAETVYRHLSKVQSLGIYVGQSIKAESGSQLQKLEPGSRASG